jgi:tetratricopeptide (TPR) repeat protein
VTGTDSDAAVSRWRRRLPWLAVAAAAIACYAPTVAYGLVQDDRQILTSPLLGRPLDLVAVWSNGFLGPAFRHLALYRPLAQWTLLLNWSANRLLFGSGDAAAGFHGVNVLLHAGASLLLLAWLRTLSLPRGAPFFAALLFAVHPVHSEAVASVSARSEPLALLFGLAFLIQHGRGRTISAVLLFLAAMWSKESAAAFLGVAVAQDLLLRRPGSRPSLRTWIAPAGALALWLALRALALRGAAPEIAFLDNPAAGAGAFRRILTAAAVQADYLRLLVWPLRQSVDYAYAKTRIVESAADPRVLLFALLLALSVAAAILARRRAPSVALALAGYALLFAATSNFLFPIGAIEAERLLYAPSAFFLLLAGSGVAALAQTPWSRPWIAVLVLLLAGLTLRQNGAWRDEGTFVRAAVVAAPGSAKAHLALAQTLEKEGDRVPAAREYLESARIYAGYGITWLLLGNLLHRTGDAEAAIEAWRSALRADPALLDARANLASLLLDLARRGEALAETKQLFAGDPLHPRVALLQDRLAETAPPEEREAALAALAAARVALEAGDAAVAVARAQEAAVSGALARSDRREALLLLASAWTKLGRAGFARTFAAAANALSAPAAPPGPAPR